MRIVKLPPKGLRSGHSGLPVRGTRQHCCAFGAVLIAGKQVFVVEGVLSTDFHAAILP